MTRRLPPEHTFPVFLVVLAIWITGLRWLLVFQQKLRLRKESASLADWCQSFPRPTPGTRGSSEIQPELEPTVASVEGGAFRLPPRGKPSNA